MALQASDIKVALVMMLRGNCTGEEAFNVSEAVQNLNAEYIRLEEEETVAAALLAEDDETPPGEPDEGE